MAAEGVQICLMEAAVLLEADWDAWVNETWVVTVPPSTANERLCARNHLQPAAAQKRIDAQMPPADRVARADIVLDNSHALGDPWIDTQLARALKGLRARVQT